MNCLVLGAGAWGTAMALHLHRCGHSVSLCPRRLEQALELASARENREYLPGVNLPHSIQIGFTLSPLLMEAEVVFLACPSKALRETADRVAAALPNNAWQLRHAITLCKGVEAESFKLPTEVVREVLPDLSVYGLSGPSFAQEVAHELPTALVLAGESEEMPTLREAFSNRSCRIYSSNDLRGVELGSVLKNVYAIGAGLCDGLQLGHNAKAAFLTRALREMVLVGISLGGRRETFLGLSGFGDLVATCHGPGSRNRSLGESLAGGSSLPSILDGRTTVTEGVSACARLTEMVQASRIDAPILSALYTILYESKAPVAALSELMERDLKTEDPLVAVKPDLN